MDEMQRTIKRILNDRIDLIRFSILHRKEIDNVSVKFVVEAFADEFIAGQFEKYTREEMLNAIRNGWIFNFRHLLIEEIMNDHEIKLMYDMELKLV